jgi:hypothetical protein
MKTGVVGTVEVLRASAVVARDKKTEEPVAVAIAIKVCSGKPEQGKGAEGMMMLYLLVPIDPERG